MAYKDFENEFDLITSLQEGDRDAISHLFRGYYQPLVGYAKALINDEAESEDIVVETFLKLIKKNKDFKAVVEVRSFLYTVTRNACYDHLRGLKVDLKAQREIRYLNSAAEDARKFDYLLMDAEIMRVLAEEIAQLPERARAVFNMIFYRKMSMKEIAVQLGVTEKTIWNEKTRAIDKLRTALLKKELLDANVQVSLIVLSILEYYF